MGLMEMACDLCKRVYVISRERGRDTERANERVITVTVQTGAKALTSTEEADAVFTQTQTLA